MNFIEINGAIQISKYYYCYCLCKALVPNYLYVIFECFRGDSYPHCFTVFYMSYLSLLGAGQELVTSYFLCLVVYIYSTHLRN